MANSKRPLVYNCMLRLTFDLAASTLLGLDPEKPGCQKLVNSFYNLVSNIFCIPLMIPGLGFSKVISGQTQFSYNNVYSFAFMVNSYCHVYEAEELNRLNYELGDIIVKVVSRITAALIRCSRYQIFGTNQSHKTEGTI